MKLTSSFKWLALAATVLGLTLVSCNKEPKEDEPKADANDVELTTQAAVDAFKARKTMNSLTIKGEDITDISAISVTTIETLIIENTGIEELVNDSFTSINKELKISGNSKLKSISNLGLKFCSAEVKVESNPLLDCIKGFQNLKKMSGNLTISGNPSLGADDAAAGDEYGFNVIKKLIDNQVLTVSQITLSNNHPDAVTDASMIGCGSSGMPSYTVRTVGDLAAITKDECQDLTILGPDIDNEVWALFKTTGLKVVHGNLYAEGCNFSMCSNFFYKETSGEGIKVEGGITFKNFVAYQENNKSAYINSDNVPTHIGGDLVLEKLWIHGWAGAGFNNVTEIDGNFTVKDCYTDNSCFGKLLTKVHGNVTIDGLLPGYNSGTKGPWNLDMGIEEIDGDVEILNNGWMTNLTGWTHLKKIGGKLTIKNNYWAGFEAQEGLGDWVKEKGLGWDLVQQWIYDGVVGVDKVECWNADGTKVEFKATAPKDIVITSQADIDALTAPEGELLVAKSLTVKGANVTDPVWANIKEKIGTVEGDLVCEDAAFTTLANFFPGNDGKGVTVKGNMTFKNIACGAGQFLNSDNFPTVVPGNLTLENVNIHGWDGAGFNLVTEIKGNLTIKTAMMGNNTCFVKLEKVGGDVTIDGPQADFNGNRIWNVSAWTIKEIGGKLSILNTKIVNFDGLKALTTLGALYVKDTEITDFTQVQTWIDNGVVKIANVECYNGSSPVQFENKKEPTVVYPADAVIVTGHDAIVALKDGERKDYGFLVLDGNGESIADSEMANLKLGIKDVETIVFINIKGWTMVEQLILPGDFTVNPTGSIYFINCPDLSNINGLKWLTKINGNLVFEDCPKIAWNWGAGNCCNQIEEITGDFIINNSATGLTGATCIKSLKKVGGNLTITNVKAGFWDLDGMPLEEIGGNFTYTNNTLVNSFKGFTGLTKIGGNLLVKGNAITDFSQVQTWITSKVLKGTASCFNDKGEQITFE